MVLPHHLRPNRNRSLRIRRDSDHILNLNGEREFHVGPLFPATVESMFFRDDTWLAGWLEVSLGDDWKRVRLGLEKSQVRTGQESG